MRAAVVVLGLVSGCGFQVPGSGAASDDTAQLDGGSDSASLDATDAPRVCDQSWPYIIGTSRYYLGSNASFDDSQTACIARGGRLTIVETLTENTAVTALLTAANATDWTWIGLTDRTAEGVDVWVDGVTVLAGDFTSYNPKIGADTDCFDFSKDPNGGKWGDWYCNTVHSFLCECDPNRP